MRLFSLIALAAPLVAAIEFNSPAANSTLTKGETFELTWSSVDTDPEKFSVYAVNFKNWPPYYAPVLFDVETAAGSASVRVPCEVDNSWGFQFNAINGTNVYVIYAQTPIFSIKGDDCTDPTTGTCPPQATVTQTVRRYSNSTSTTTPITSIAPAVTTTVVVKITSAICPNTIGWSGNYDHPVSLTSAPHPPGITPGPTTVGSSEAYATTSTITQTVYRDLSEGCGAC